MKRPNLYDWLKVIAVLTMIVDHAGYVFFPEISWLRLIGRIAFPIFLFLVGFNGDYKRRWDLLLCAIVIQIPIFVLSFGFERGNPTLNILFGIILGRMVLKLFGKSTQTLLSQGGLLAIIIVLLCFQPWVAKVVDYGSFVVLLPLLGWMMRHQIATSGNAINRRFYSSQGRCLLYGMVVMAGLFVFSEWVFGFDLLQKCVMGAFFGILLCIFFLLGQENRFLPVGKKIDHLLLFLSKNSLYIYVFHLFIMGIIKVFLLEMS